MQSRHTDPLLPPPSCLVEACLFVSQAEIELLKFFWPYSDLSLDPNYHLLYLIPDIGRSLVE